MKITRLVTALLLAGPLVWVPAAEAGETPFRGVSVDYGSASTNWVDGELVLKYTGSSSLMISGGAVRADILLVGGGGGGGRSNSSSSYYGSGNGGSVLAITNQTLLGGSYEIAVGSGGSGATSNGKSGSAGGGSSLKGGSVSETAAGGDGGGTSAAAGTPTTGTESLITGTSVFYGKGGVKVINSTTAGNAGTNPGDGGTGNKKGSSGGDGAKGIVVVRLTSVEEPEDPPPEEDKTLTVQKTVVWDPDDVSNATIRVWSHVPAAQLDVIAPNVLFIGTMCNAHELTVETVRKSLNAIASKANVDWYLYPTDYNEDRAGSRRQGTLGKGGSLGAEFESDLSMSSANHQALKSFYKTIYDVATDPVRSNKYDYIVFEFDGSRLAHQYVRGADYDEAVVARFLTPYYQTSNVIWVVDNCSYGDKEPYHGNEYYTPNAFAYGSRVNNLLSDVQYRSLIGLMDPDYYFSNTCYTATKEWGSSSYSWTVWTTEADGSASSTTAKGKKQVWANRRYEKQITYDNAETLSNYLKENIIQHACDLKFVDKVVDVGLTIVTARLYRAESPLGVDEPEGWMEIEPPELRLQICGSVVTAVVENVTKELWAKLEIVARDDGTFKTSEGAVLVNGKWKKNPNDGAANVKMTDEAKGDVYAEGDAYTDLSWEDEQGRDTFVAYVIRGVVENGELTINGVKTNELAVSEGYSPVVTYRGDPGYRLVTITDATDEGQTEVDVPGHPTEYVVANLRTNHLVTVCYAPVVVDSVPYEGPYDAAGHIIEVDLPEESADLKDFSAKYAFDEEGEYLPADEFGGATNVSVRTVYYKVYATQTGYDEPQLVASGSNTVTIWPHPLEIWANNTNMVWGTEIPVPTYRVQGDLVNDEGPAVLLDYTNATWNVGTYPDAITTNAPIVVTNATGADVSVNYNVIFHPGTLTVTAATMGITAFPAEKFYDAEPTNITWIVTNAAGVAITDATISLREKGTTAWIPAADFAQYVDTTNVTVEVKAEKSGFASVTAEAALLVKPRQVTLVAGSDSKVYDGTPLTCDDFEVKDDDTTAAIPGYGFVNDEGVASVTMTDGSTITDPGSQSNVIASETAKDGTKLDRNYTVTTEPGTLTVTPATFTASATSYDEFYDGQEHAIDVEVQKPERAGEATITYSYAEGGTYLPIEDFGQLKDVTASGPVTVYAKVEIEGYATVAVNATVNIKPRIVVEQAESASKIFDGTPLVQPNHFEDTDIEAVKSKERWGTDEPLANSTGFVTGEGFAEVPMTAGSTITEPGVEDNMIDAAAVTLLAGTKPGNYIFFYLPGELAVIQRQEEVRRDPEIVIPEEAKEAVEKSDKKIEKTLDEMAKADQEQTGEPYVKYQLTVTPTNHLDETTRTSPEKVAEDAKKQIELAESETGSKIDKVEFVDIVLERTYSKEEAESTAAGDYNKDNWESLDKAEEHGYELFEVTIPVEVPEGLELAGVTRSCDSRGTEILKPKDPNDPNAEGFVYDPGTKTVTLYARDFCVFGFMMKENATPTPPPSPHGGCDLEEEKPVACVYKFKANAYTTKGVVVNARGRTSVCDPNATSCLVMRGKDKTVIEGWLYQCECTCDGLGEEAILWDSRRKAPFADEMFETLFLNVMGSRNADAEWAWTFKGTAQYDSVRTQEYELVGSGYGTFSVRAGRFASFSGCFAGTASAPYDLVTKRTAETADCLCLPSQVLKCYSVDALEFSDEPTAVFGKWKVKYDASASKTYRATGLLNAPGYVK